MTYNQFMMMFHMLTAIYINLHTENASGTPAVIFGAVGLWATAAGIYYAWRSYREFDKE